MKFNHGFWLMKTGIEAFYASEVAEIQCSEDQITLLAPTKVIQERGDTLNLPLITVSYHSPMENVISVKICHHKGTRFRGPEFDLGKGGKGFSHGVRGNTCQIIRKEEQVILQSGNLEVRTITKGPWMQEFWGNDRQLTNSGWRNTGYARPSLDQHIGSEAISPQALSGQRFEVPHVFEQLRLAPGEVIHGLGERFTSLVKNGQSIDLWNEDAGTSSEQSYKNIPFYLSNHGYGVFINYPGKVSLEVGSEKVSRVSIAVPEETLEYLIIYGPEPKTVLSRLTALTGRSPLPPAWSFGLWLSTSFTTSYDEQTITSFIDGMEQRNIPLSVFHFDTFWMKRFSWVDFKWDSEVFPDPKGLLSRLHQRGIKISVWINPYIAQQSLLFSEAAEGGYLLQRSNGDIWQTDQWQGGMGIVDFTNPEAVSWYKEKLKILLDDGVDCFKTDFGERIPLDVCYSDGSDPVRMHNYYTYLYNRAVYELICEVRGRENALLFARSATAGSQKFPVHWGGDCLASWDSMAESLRGGLSLCSSGFSFWSHDIGGFEKTATPELYKRWAAFGLLSTHSRLHGSESYRVPWHFDDEASLVLAHFSRLKNRLMPYLYRYALQSAQEGIPLMRSMMIEFPHDPTTAWLDRQYCLGPDLLVAPIMEEGGRCQWYVPKGLWTNILDGSIYQGPAWYENNFDVFSLPLLARPGSLIAMGPGGLEQFQGESDGPVYDYTKDVELHIYQPEYLPSSGNMVHLVNTNGTVVAHIRAVYKNNELDLFWEGVRNITFIINSRKHWSSSSAEVIATSGSQANQKRDHGQTYIDQRFKLKTNRGEGAQELRLQSK